MDINKDLKSHHAEIGAHILRQTHLQELIELFVDVLQLLLDGGFGEDILLPQHFSGLLGKQVFTAFHHLRQLTQDLTVHLLGGDVTSKARVVHHVAGFIAYQGRFGGVAKFIKDKTGEKRLSRHIVFSSLSAAQSKRMDTQQLYVIRSVFLKRMCCWNCASAALSYAQRL